MVIAPYTASYSERSPYISLAEFKFSPTASAIDFTNLVEGGGQAAQDRALSDLITRASNMADTYTTTAPWGTIGASVNTESGRFRANRQGQFVIKPQFWPIIALDSFSWQYAQGGTTVVTLTSQNTWIEPTQFIVMAPWGTNGITVSGSLNSVAGGFAPQYEALCEYTYVNGWANAFLTAEVAAESNSVHVTTSTGIYPGSPLTIWDGMNDENVTVSESYDGSSLTLPLTSNLTYRHGSGCNISALPPVVKQAVIHFTVAMIKDRGQGGIVLAETGFEQAASSKGMISADDYALGYDLLDEFKNPWGRG